MRRTLALLALVLPLLAGCGRGALHQFETEIAAAWSELQAHYRARAEALSALMQITRSHGGPVQLLAAAGDALSQAEKLRADDSLVDDAAAFAAFQRAQRDLGLALGRLLAGAEGMEQIRADPAFGPLKSRLLETGKAIAVARNRYVRAVRDYNVARETMPAKLTALALGYGPKANFTLENERDPAHVPLAGEEQPGVPQGKVAQPPTLINVPGR